MLNHFLPCLIVFALAAPAALAQMPQMPSHTEHNRPPEQRGSTLTWEELTNLEIEVETPAPLQTIFHVKFPPALQARDGQQVNIEGFMYPLKTGKKHDYFLLSALPPSCPFCLPGGQTTLIEVNCTRAVPYTLEPVLLQGTFHLLRDDPSGLYYRLSDARAADG